MHELLFITMFSLSLEVFCHLHFGKEWIETLLMSPNSKCFSIQCVCETLSTSFPSPESCDLSLARCLLSLFSFSQSSIFFPKYHGWLLIPGMSIRSFSLQSIFKMRLLASTEMFRFLGKTTVLDIWYMWKKRSSFKMHSNKPRAWIVNKLRTAQTQVSNHW